MTPRQQETLTFIRDFTTLHGVAPSLREIASHLGLKSASGALRLVDGLVAIGKVRRNDFGSRNIEVVGFDPGILNGLSEAGLRDLVARSAAMLAARIGGQPTAELLGAIGDRLAGGRAAACT